MMVSYTINLVLLGFWTLSIIRYYKEHNISEADVFWGWETPTLLGLSERANPNHWI
jgi:hypothetical protein